MSTSPPLVVADRYRLVAPLGQGGMGRVWRATDVVLHRDVAIKELVPPPGLTQEERQEMRERSLREARAIARLNNVNVVRIFDVLRTDADPWIVMEYVPSRSLQDTLAADGPYPPLRVAEIGLGVLNALRAAHRNGVVHRDVKPGNVLIGEDGRVVLTDFGLATVPGDPNVTRTGLVLGSPAYISPERARDGTAGPGSDLWGLGATLYAAVEGASPFARPSAIATLAALATENPPPARNAGPLKPVLNGLLRKDPAHRINAEETERLLLRASGRRSRLSFPMSPTMRRPGVGRERPALPGTPPVVPGAPSPTVSGSAPVVPGPRPPVGTGRPPAGTARPPAPPVTPGRPQPGDEGRRPPIFAPGKASVGPPPPVDNPTRVDAPQVNAPRLDATRVDTPPVRDTPKSQPVSGTSAAASTEPTSAQGALARGTRGAFGTISAAEIAAHRTRTRPEAASAAPVADPTEAPPAADAATAVPQPATAPAAESVEQPADQAVGATAAPVEAAELAAPAEPVTSDSADAAESVSAARAAETAPATDVEEADAAAPADSAPGGATAAGAAADRPADSASGASTAAGAAGAEEAAGKPAEAAGGIDADADRPAEAAASRATAGPEASDTQVEALADDQDEAAGAQTAAASAGTATSSQPSGTVRAGSSPTAEAAAPVAPAGTAPVAGVTTPESAGPTTDPAVGGPITDADPTPEAKAATPAEAEQANVGEASTAGDAAAAIGAAAAGKAPTPAKPTVGARAGGATSKSARKKGRGRIGAPAQSTTAAAEPAEENVEQVQVGSEPTAPESKPADLTTIGAAASTVPADTGKPEARAGAKPVTEVGAGPETKAAAEAGIDAEAKTEVDADGESESKGEVKADAKVLALPKQTGGKASGKASSNASTKASTTASTKTGATAKPETSAKKVAAARTAERKVTTAQVSDPKPGATAILKTPAQGGGKVPGFAPPSRPAWQPMTVPQRDNTPRGVTLFGTSLTRRQTVIAGAVVLAVLLVLVLLVPRAFGDDDKDNAGNTPAQPQPSAAATTSAAPAAPPAASQAPTSAAPPSSAPASSAAPAADVPKGWYRYSDSTGFSVPLPNGWKARRQGTEVYFQGTNNRLLIIDQTDSPKSDPVADWEAQEAQRRNTTYRDYSRIRIDAVDYFQKAADWEFTYKTGGGNAQHAQKRGFVVSSKKAYGISFYTSPGDWDANKAVLDVIYKGFKPA